MKLGVAGGALVGIETGPGAIVTGLIGGIAASIAGYFGFYWIADHIDANQHDVISSTRVTHERVSTFQ